jgi:LysR family transcriptional regulator, glycine cleavage system transcriptional activator
MSKSLPPLNAIRAFEVASRHLTLSRAAEELGVTQGAISKQIIALEDFIGVQVFERSATGLALTSEGYNLKEALNPVFATMVEAFARYSRRPPRSNIARISTLASFASQFLVPRLSTFRATHPEIDLEILTGNRLVDFAREEIDIGVRYGDGTSEGAVHTMLAPGLYVPICAPYLLEMVQGDVCALLNTVRRIQHSTFNEWRRWSQLAGIDVSDLSRPIVLEDFLVALKAAVTGEGVALLPEILVRDHIRRGELAIFSPVSVESEYTFYIAHPPGAERRPLVRDLIAWLRAEAGAT